MNIFERFGLAFKFIRGKRGTLPAISSEKRAKIPFLWPEWMDSTPQWKLVDLQAYVNEGFSLNSIVYSSIMYKARASMQAPLRAYTGTRESFLELPEDNYLQQLVTRPNKYQPFPEFQALNIVYLNITGNCYIYLDREGVEGVPQALYTLRPDRVYILPNRRKRKELLGYLYVPEGVGVRDGIPIVPMDMMHVKFPNPLDPLEGLGEGLSPLSCVARNVDVDNAVTHFLKLFFDKGVTVPGLLTTDERLDDRIAARIRERWKNLFGGYLNWAEEIAILERGLKYQRVGLGFEEMGFDTIDQRNESRIMSPFGVPPILTGSRVGLERATYSNYGEARQAFWEDTLVPELTLFSSEYNHYLYIPGEAWVNFDYSDVPALIEAGAVKRKEAQSAYEAGALTKNELRRALGYGDVPGGDTFRITWNYIEVPVGETLSQEDWLGGSPVVQSGGEQVEEPEMDSVHDTSIESKEMNAQAKLLHWKMFDKQASSWEPKFEEEIYEAFSDDLRSILVILNRAKKDALTEHKSIDWELAVAGIVAYLRGESLTNWTNRLSPVIAALMIQRAEQLSQEFDTPVNAEELLVEDWYRNYIIQFAQPISESSEIAIRALLSQGQQEGWGIDVVSNHLETLFQQWMLGNLSSEDFAWYDARLPEYRREAIARTETISASNAVSQAIYRVWGVKKKEWLAIMDDRVRTSPEGGHAAANGQIRSVNMPFDVGGEQLMYPGDKNASAKNVVNCRCTTVPVPEL